MLKPLKIPLMVLFAGVALLTVGELASGTHVTFVAMMAGTILCIGITYNLLGGISTISGIAFTVFSLCTIVISQIAKVLFLEPADKNLEDPLLTINVYLVFYFCVMVGVFVYGRLRVKLPKPLEPATVAQVELQYVISVSIGLFASFVATYYEIAASVGGKSAEGHSLGLAFSSLLYFSLVLAVQSRIRSTGGRHSIGIKVLIPMLAAMLIGFLRTSRGGIIIPTVVYALTCYVSGYRLRRLHYLAGITWIVLVVSFISPFELYSRGNLSATEIRGRVYETFNLLLNVPKWTVVEAASAGGAESGSREEYFDRPGTFVLSRVSAIRADSNMISACSNGFHYGFIALKQDILYSIPHFLYKNKPDEDSAGYLGRVTGVNPDNVENEEVMITSISDSFGAFGWFGVVVVGLIVFPCTFVLYESIFDIKRPWGIVALGSFVFLFSEVSLGGLFQVLTRLPVALVSLSYFVGAIVAMIPIKGDRGIPVGSMAAEASST